LKCLLKGTQHFAEIGQKIVSASVFSSLYRNKILIQGLSPLTLLVPKASVHDGFLVGPQRQNLSNVLLSQVWVTVTHDILKSTDPVGIARGELGRKPHLSDHKS
jgi:hypothetical protein